VAIKLASRDGFPEQGYTSSPITL